jgi:hypothetical protein
LPQPLLGLKIAGMTTLTVTQARRNFTALLKRAASGEEIGIRYCGKFFILTLVDEEDTLYAEKEFGVQKRLLDQRRALNRDTRLIRGQGSK